MKPLLDRIRTPAAIRARERGPTQQMIEADAKLGAARKIGVRVEKIAQHAPQRARCQGFARQVPIEMQVEPRHVNAARLRIFKIDERGDASADSLRDAVRLRDQHRQLDLVHTDQIEPATETRLCLDGDVGHDAQCVFPCRHGSSLSPRASRLHRSCGRERQGQ